MAITKEFRTDYKITWCPGCPNYMILEAAARAMKNLTNEGYKKENFAMAAGIGCHAKIFDYLNISGVYGLHGRTIPTAMGIKMGNPNLTVLAFAGDGDTYAEGMEHFIHVFRFNPDITLFVHDNQSFSLTAGQATPTSQLGFKTKAEPLGEFNPPLNPVRLALSAGASFVARANAYDLEHMTSIMEQAIKHKGFSYVEIMQDCIIFNLEINKKEMIYKLESPNTNLKKAMEIADEWNYNDKKGKIAIGIIYKEDKPCLEDKWPQLQTLKKNKVNWKEMKR